MLRYIKDNLTTIEGIELFPIVSLLIFVVFFIGLFWWVIRSDKRYLEEMSNYPLNENE